MRLIIILFFIGFPFAFLFVGIYYMIKDIIAKKRCTEIVDAEIVGISEHRDSEGSTMYSPVYGYTYEGVEYKRTTDLSKGHCSLSVGDHVEILVDPSDPTRFRSPKEKVSRFIFDFAFIAVGIYCAVHFWGPYIMKIIHKIF